VDLVPGLSKTDIALKNIQGKISDAEEKLLKNEEVSFLYPGFFISSKMMRNF
jgi:hypothetical protein